MTTPDITFSINQAAAYVSDPGEEHWNAVNEKSWPTSVEPFITVFSMAIAPTRLYSATQTPTGLENSKNENQPSVFYFSSIMDQYHTAVDVNEQQHIYPKC